MVQNKYLTKKIVIIKKLLPIHLQIIREVGMQHKEDYYKMMLGVILTQIMQIIDLLTKN